MPKQEEIDPKKASNHNLPGDHHSMDNEEKCHKSIYAIGELKQQLRMSGADEPVYFRCHHPTGDIIAVDYACSVQTNLNGHNIDCIVLTSAFEGEIDKETGELNIDARGQRVSDTNHDIIEAGCLNAEKLLQVLERYDSQLPVFVSGRYVPEEIKPARVAERTTYSFFGNSLPCVIVEV